MDTPSRKVGAGALSGAITTIILWAVTAFTGVDVPAAVGAALVTVITFITSYFIKEP